MGNGAWAAVSNSAAFGVNDSCFIPSMAMPASFAMPTVLRMTTGSPACCPHAMFALDTRGMIWSSRPSV